MTSKSLGSEIVGVKDVTIRQTVRRTVEDQQLDTDDNGHYFAPSTYVTPVTQSHETVTPLHLLQGDTGEPA